jgi:hypothetical protein
MIVMSLRSYNGHSQPKSFVVKKSNVKESKTAVSIIDQSLMGYTVYVQWQMLRSRAHLSLAGTTTEWALTVRGSTALVTSPHAKLELPWVQSSFDLKAGTLQMTRDEFAKLLGIQQELPQDGRLWESDGPVSMIIQPADGRNFEPIFRFVDDNGMILVRLSARVASKP